MIWHNDWVWHNLDERKVDKSLDFLFGVNPRPFKSMTFKDASYYTAKKLYDDYKNIYVSLSGGMDSLYVTKIFHEMDIPFTPVIIDTDANRDETKYAFDYCDENKIIPKVFSLSYKEVFEFYLRNRIHEICKYGLNTSPVIMTGFYAKENNGISISGEFIISENDDTILCNDYDLVADLYVNNKAFFYYTEEICYSMIKEVQIPFQHNKHSLYGFEYRDKIRYENSKINTMMNNLLTYYGKQYDRITQHQHVLSSMKDFLKKLERKIF